MLTPEATESLELEIYDWLKTKPSREEILDYVEKIPDDAKSVAYSAAVGLVEHLYDEKYRYLTENGAQVFALRISEPEQYDALVNCTRYNPPSVAQKLQVAHSDVPQITLPSTITAWARTFLDALGPAITMIFAQEYQHTRLYVSSLAKLHAPDALRELEAQLHDLYLKDGSAFDSQRTLTQADIDAWNAFFLALGFFPKDYCHELAANESYIERIEICTRLVDAFAIVTGQGQPERYDAILTLVLQERVTKKILASQEGIRRARTEIGTDLKQFYDALTKAWSEESIMTNQAAAMTQALFSSETDLSGKIDLYDFLRDNLVVEGILDPLDPSIEMSNIVTPLNMADVDAYITETVGLFEEDRKPLVRSLLKQSALALRK